MNLEKKLQMLRKKNGYSQEQLADKSQINRICSILCIVYFLLMSPFIYGKWNVLYPIN